MVVFDREGNRVLLGVLGRKMRVGLGLGGGVYESEIYPRGELKHGVGD